MQMDDNLCHAAQQFALTGLSLVTACLFLATAARAEFEIKESQIEKGEVDALVDPTPKSRVLDG
jgi:hypothetical protein